MNKLLIIILCLFIISCNKDKISDVQSDYFIKFYGNSGIDYGYDVIQSSDGNYVVLATTISDSTQADVILIKTDKYGNKLWQSQNIGDTLNDIANKIIEHNNSYYFIGTDRLTDTDYDILIGKVSSSGQLENKTLIGGPGRQVGNSFVIDQNNEIIIVGSTNVLATGDTLEDDYTNLFFLKTNIDGDSISSNIFFGPSFENSVDYCIDIELLDDGNYAVMANTPAFDATKTKYTILLIQLSSNLNYPKTFTVNPNDPDEFIGTSILVTQDQSIYLTGSQRNIASTNTSIFIAKLNNSFGNLEWSKTVGGDNNDVGYDLTECPQGIALIGKSASFGNGSDDIYFEKFNSNGETLNTFKNIGGSGDEEGRSLYFTSDEGFIITGSNKSDVSSDIALIKTNNLGDIK